MTDLKPYEREVRSYKGVHVGQRVKVRALIVLQWGAASITANGVAKRAAPGTVKRIVVNDTHGWNSMLIAHDGGHEGWQSVEDLEKCPS